MGDALHHHELDAALKAMPIIVIARGDFADILPQLLPRLRAHAIHLFEVTLNSPRALETIRTLALQHPDMLIGAGTVTRVEHVAQAAEAGARFLVCPHTDVEIIHAAHQHGVPIIPGAFTPSEILTAYHAGAHHVKLFPAMPFGPAYIRQLRGPLPEVALLVTGGVTPDNAADFLKAGASAVALGSSLIDATLRAANGWVELDRKLKTLIENIQAGL